MLAFARQSGMSKLARFRGLALLAASIALLLGGLAPAVAYAQPAASSTAPTSAAAPTSNQDAKESGCSIANMGQCVVDAFVGGISRVIAAIAYVILLIASFILWIVGNLFNLVVVKTVLEFGSYFGASQGLLDAWAVIRDIGNIILLFGFIFMGIATILNTHAMDAYSARNALPKLIIFAVLLNFSLFAAQAVIDVSNGFASVLTAQAGIDCKTDGSAEANCANVGITGAVFEVTGMSNVWELTKGGAKALEEGRAEQLMMVYVGLALFVTITAVVLLAGAIMLIIRAVVLLLLMITSPIGFAGMALPPLQGLAHEWWDALIKQAFFAPVYILLILISITVAKGVAGTADGFDGSLAAALLGESADIQSQGPQIFVLFTIIIGLMIASLIFAKRIGAIGADFATKSAGGAVMGGMAMVGRRTAGRGMYAAAQGLRSTSFGRTGIGKFATQQLDKGGKASFDMRATALGKVGGVNLGTAKKGGYEKILHDAEEDRVKYAKSLKNTASEKDVIGEIDIQMKAKQRKDAQEMRNLEAAQADERRPLDEEIAKRQKEVAEARARGDKEALATAETSLNNLRREYDNMREEQRNARTKLESEHKAWMAGQEQAKKDFQQAPQREFVRNLVNKGPVVGPAMRAYDAVAGVSYGADHHAAEKILKELGKNDAQKLLDALNANIANSGGGHGGGGHAPAAPAGGGGGHGGGGAKPSGGGGGHH